jgi:pimeloyl-ACP methyl ester carboxylesterase
MSVRPFTIAVAEDVLADLKARLSRVRWPDEAPGAAWAYGTSLEYMKELVAYWRDKYDWRAAEARLNGARHFTAPVAGIDVHFIHEQGVGPRPFPLLLSHGWPGSIVEFEELIPRLTDPARFGGRAEDAFTVVAPSLPGYTFSFRPHQPRFSVAEIADVFATLMTDVLGYRRFAAQGGDWGAFVTSVLGLKYPDRLAGIHVNLLAVKRDVTAPANPDADERRYLEQLRHWQREGTGYQWIHGTRPQTLAFGLTDSPVGLAAWIVEKFRAWSDCDGDVERCFTKDVLLTNVMLYWVTQTAASSARIYYETRHIAPAVAATAARRVEVPTACADFPKEIIWAPRRWMEARYNITRWTVMPRGGHFAALEQPALLVDDIRAFFRDLRR